MLGSQELVWKEITKSKIIILSVSCAKSNAVNHPKLGFELLFIHFCPMLTALLSWNILWYRYLSRISIFELLLQCDIFALCRWKS